jgi:hypothetical protein
MNRDSTSPAGRAFYVMTMTAALCIGALQMFRVRGGFITNYGADLVGTGWLNGSCGLTGLTTKAVSPLL